MAPSAPSKASDKSFREPRVAINKVYTRTGDDGTTGIVGGHRLQKDDPRLEAYGTVDELNAWLGLARAAAIDTPSSGRMADHLLRVQQQLFNLGSQLSTLPQDLKPAQPVVSQADVDWLERSIDRLTPNLPPLRSFVLPGGSRLNALLHLSRTVCRRAERVVVHLHRLGGCGPMEVHYLNRLSDALFVWSRQAARDAGTSETLWEPNKA